jgi:hypothetical protein
MRQLLCLFLLSCLLIRPAAARDIFVDNASGDDKNTGLHAQTQGDTSSPVQTIAKALRLAKAGDRIVLAASERPYHESIALVGTKHGGAGPRLPFILEGNGAVLDGSAPMPAAGWKHFRDNIFRFRSQSLVRPVVFMNGRALQPRPLPEFAEYPPKLAPLEWCAIHGAIYMAVGLGHVPPDYKLSCAELPTGITLYQVDHVVIRNLMVQGFQADGISAAVGARHVVLDNVTCTANGRSGICVGGGAQVEIESCKLAGNGQAQLLTKANSETHLLASALAGDTAPGWSDAGGRFYLGSKQMEGGKQAIRAEDAPLPVPPPPRPKANEEGAGQ